MKNTKITKRQKSYLNFPGEKTEEKAHDQNLNETANDMRESINSALFSMSPRQYWAGPHFFFNTILPKKK